MRLDHANEKEQGWRGGPAVESPDSYSMTSGFDFTQSHGKTWPFSATVLYPPQAASMQMVQRHTWRWTHIHIKFHQ